MNIEDETDTHTTILTGYHHSDHVAHWRWFLFSGQKSLTSLVNYRCSGRVSQTSRNSKVLVVDQDKKIFD